MSTTNAAASEAAATEDASGAAPLPWLFRSQGRFAWVLAVCGAIGLFASFMLTLEFIHKLQFPNEGLLCDINPFVTCGPAMLSDASHVLGFPNIILGLVCFTITVTIAASIWAGARFRTWFWICYQLGLVGAAVLITYLQLYSVFTLEKLCIWCMTIWAGTIPLVALTTIFELAHGKLGSGAPRRVGAALASWAWVVVVIWYLAVVAVIFGGMSEAFFG